MLMCNCAGRPRGRGASTANPGPAFRPQSEILSLQINNPFDGIDRKDAKHSGWEGTQKGLLSWADQSRADSHPHPYEEQQ